MAFYESTTSFYKSSQYFGYGEPAKVAQCDFCFGTGAAGKTIDDAKTKAMKAGWVFVKGNSFSEPMKLCCSSCKERLNK